MPPSMNAFQSRLNVGIFYDDDRIECWAKVVKMGLRFEFDPANKILMTRLEGELTDELVIQTDAGMRKHLLEKGPHIHIVDCSSVSKFSVSGESVRSLARRQPALHGGSCRRFFVMPSIAAFGLARMFQIAGEPHYDSVTIARSIDEVFTTLAIEQPRFELLESA
jgi:hypothetical protein